MSALARIPRRLTRMLEVRRTNGRSPAGVPLPPRSLRAGGRHFASDEAFVSGGRRGVLLLIDRARLDVTSTVLDVGCGAGRLAIGIVEVVGPVAAYFGLDVRSDVIDWDRRFLTRRHPWLRFEHIDVTNERYNTRGRQPATGFVLPFGPGWFDIVYAYSVFSHMTGEDAAAYLGEFRRVLRPAGVAVLTAFVENDVPDETINPTDYGPIAWEGALHCVRLRTGYFIAMVQSAGLEVLALDHGVETDGQSLFVVARGRA